MALTQLALKNFRCISNAELEFDPRCTTISGANASGKTSLLEAIHVLSCGHSFRTNRRELLIGSSAAQFEVIGEIASEHRAAIAGLAGRANDYDLRINGERIKGFSKLASLFPTRVIDPEIHRLVEGGPGERRQFMDWGVFHVEQEFASAWRRYQRALRQRNAALKAKLPKSIAITWNQELATAGEKVAECRERYMYALGPFIAKTALELLGGELMVTHQRGWSKDVCLADALISTYEKDQRYLATTVGPHRADLSIKIWNVTASARVSRGQQKLVAAALLLAQIRHWVANKSDSVSLLLDDPAAELDVDNFKRLMKMVTNIPCQLIVTALDTLSIHEQFGGSLFHVERGSIEAVL